MCGIGFAIAYDGEQMNLKNIQKMFLNMEQRGDDSAGIYYEREEDGQTVRNLFKGPVPATLLWEAIQEGRHEGFVKKDFADKWKLNGTEQLIMLHTRRKTHGTQFNNENNMPITSKNWVLIHNGVVYSTPRLENYPYKGEVDSEEIIARIQKKKSVVKAIPEITGSMAIATKRINGHSLFVYRNTNPLDLMYCDNENILYGCSIGEYLDGGSSSDLKSIFSRDRTKIIEVPSMHVYKINLNKPEVEDIGYVSRNYAQGGSSESKK